MDLTDMLSDNSLVDHSWYKNGLIKQGQPNFDPQKEGIMKRNNIKPELEMEWGNAGPRIDFERIRQRIQEKKNQNNNVDIEEVIKYIRDLLNSGKMGIELMRSIYSKYDRGTIRSVQNAISGLLKLEGLAGCVIVDGRGYDSCQEALALAKNSPFKRFIKYTLGCQCGDPIYLPANENSIIQDGIVATDNSLDNFLSQDDKHETELVAHCPTTRLKILSSIDDIDRSFVNDTLINMHNVGGLSESIKNSLTREDRVSKKPPYRDIQTAFHMIAMKNFYESRKANQIKIDNSEHIIERADNAIDIDKKAQSDIEVNPVNPAIQHEVEVVKGSISTVFDGPDSLPKGISDIDLANMTRKEQIAVEMTDGDNSSEIKLQKDTENKSVLDIDANSSLIVETDKPVTSSVLDIDANSSLNVETDKPVTSIDIELTQFKEKEFEGTDVIDIPDEKEAEGELDIKL